MSSSSSDFSYGGTIFVVLWLIGTIVGLVKLLRNWDGYGNKAWPMLLVIIIFPGVGWLWPFLTTPDAKPMYVPSRYQRAVI